MTSKLDLALDDVIKQNKKSNRKQFPQKRSQQQQNRQRSTSSFSQRFTNRSQQQNKFGGNGGIQKRSGNINSRLGSSRFSNNNNNNNGQRNSRPPRRNTNQPWAHDLFKEGSSIQSRLGNRHVQQRRNQPQAVILVENVHYDVTEDDLKDVFNLVGTVEKCRIQYDKSGRSTGSAKVTFSHSDAVQKAINKFNNVDFDGQPMKISTPEKSNFNDRKSSSSGSTSASRYGLIII
ncbi:unnamed protein product [Cunninghamella blakesleeana]